MSPILRIILGIYFLPILLLIDLFSSKREGWKKFGYFLLILLFFFWIWIGSYAKMFNALRSRLSPRIVSVEKTGSAQVKEDTGRVVYTVGTSMLPTIKSGTNVTIYDPQIKGIARFDIVSLTNKQTDGSYYMKRVVGMPGDAFSIQNGYVVINGKILKEPYVLNDLPTYGNTALIDCESYTVPADSYVVMGDNRTVSHDSRVIGFVTKSEIEGVMKSSVKEEYLSLAESERALPKAIDPVKFLAALQAQREASVSGKLRLSTHLNGIANRRSAVVRDKLAEWKKLELPIDQALQKEGYRYNLAHEYVTFGHLTEVQLVNQIFESTIEKEHFSSSRYTDVGVGYVTQVVGACTYPVISVIVSWPSYPDYSKETIEYWRKEAEATESNLQILQGYVGNSYYDQTKLQRYIAVEAEMNTISKQLYARTKSNSWFTAADSRANSKYKSLVDEAWALEGELF
jgi:signal peptidase I